MLYKKDSLAVDKDIVLVSQVLYDDGNGIIILQGNFKMLLRANELLLLYYGGSLKLSAVCCNSSCPNPILQYLQNAKGFTNVLSAYDFLIIPMKAMT